MILSLLVAISVYIGLAPVSVLLSVDALTVSSHHRRFNHRQRHQQRADSSSSLQSSVINEIDSFYQTFPYASAFITCGIKASAADLVAQQNEVITTSSASDNNDNDDVVVDARSLSAVPTTTASVAEIVDEGLLQQIDAKRNLSFIMYGGLYQGIAQFIIYNQIFPLMFGDGTDIVTVLSKVAFDNMFISPLVCLPVAYLAKSIVFQFSLEEAKERYIHDVKDGLIFKYWSFWVPAQSLTFSVIPTHLRIVWVAAVSFFWLVVFSSISSNSTKDE